MSLADAFRHEQFPNGESAYVMYSGTASGNYVAIVYLKQPVAHILPLFMFLVIFNEQVKRGNSC